MAALGTKSLTFHTGGSWNPTTGAITGTQTEVTSQVSKVEIDSAETDSDFVSFADAAAGGGRDYSLAVTATQDLVTGTLWDQVWTNAGSKVAVTIRPYGNATPTA